MSMFRLNHLAAAALAVFAADAFANDELMLYAFRDGAPVTDLSASLDGGSPVPSGANGSFTFDLAGGAHSIQFIRDGKPVYAFRFNSATGQLVDVDVRFAAQGEPDVSVESYFPSETAVERSQAPAGRLTGVVVMGDRRLAGATVRVGGTEVTATTDAEGRFDVELPRGRYTLQISHADLPAPASESARVVTGVQRVQTFAVGAAATAGGGGLEEIIITAAPIQAGETERTALAVVDTLDSESLARYGDSEVSASVMRVPSITIQSGKFVFIRGMGDRYITTSLNGSTMPSPDPSRRTVPLDLFPSNIVNQLDVRKTFTPDMPGDSTGGNLVIRTRTFPNAASGKLSFSLGMTPGLTGKSVYSDPENGAFDFVGWDDGSRKKNGLLPLISTALDYSDEYSESTLQELRRAGGLLIMDGWELDKTTATPKVNLGLNYGDVITFSGDREFGYFVAGNYKNNWKQRDDGVSRTYNSLGGLKDDFHFEEYSNEIELSGLLAMGLNVGNNSFTSTTLISRNTEGRVKVSEGEDGDALLPSYRYTIEWEERQFISQQLTGEHLLTDAGDLVGKWQATASQARRYAPDRRDVRFDLEEGDGVYNLQTSSLLRRFDDLTDDNLDISAAVEYSFDLANATPAKLSGGVQVIDRDRDSDSETYGYDGGLSLDDNAPNLLVSDVINVQTITGDADTGYLFSDETLPSDSYTADMHINAVYAMLDTTLFGSLQTIVGGRYEDYRQNTNTFDIVTGEPDDTPALEKNSFLPSLSLNWAIDAEQQLRFAASRTVSRPDFKETSNATYYDQEFDFRVRGNPELKVASITNVDLRWERYFSAQESISVAAFYKDLKDPIERVVQPASGTAGNSRTFENADSADIYGLELDGRHDFSLNQSFTRTLFIAFNGSWIHSTVDLASGESRKLQGQPDYTANLIFGYDDIEAGQEATLLLNQSGESIEDVGVSGAPNVLQKPRLSLNFNYRYDFTDALSLKFKANNLLDSDYEFTQGGQVYQRYQRGVELEAGIDWTF